jgi:hypothetical protein
LYAVLTLVDSQNSDPRAAKGAEAEDAADGTIVSFRIKGERKGVRVRCAVCRVRCASVGIGAVSQGMRSGSLFISFKA